MTHGSRESDSPIVSKKPLNKETAAAVLAEGVQRRGLAKGNVVKQPRVRAQYRGALQQELDRIRQFAGRHKDENPASISVPAAARDYLKQEPGAVVPHAGICAGGAGQPAFLPQQIQPWPMPS